MNTFTIGIIVTLGVVMIAGAIVAVQTKNIVAAVIISGVISLLASILYLFLAAPDVAMTEAAIGSGLTTIVFLYAMSKIRGEKEEEND